MKQYRVYFRAPKSEQWAVLEPGVHSPLYSNAAVQAAVQAVRDNPAFEGICCRHDGNLFNVMVLEQEAVAPNSFPLEQQ